MKISTGKTKGYECDNCGYRDDNMVFHNEESYKQLVGKPCPQCGNILLKEADYESIMRAFKETKIYIANLESQKKKYKEDRILNNLIRLEILALLIILMVKFC